MFLGRFVTWSLANYPTASNYDTYTLAGRGLETWEPQFGFRGPAALFAATVMDTEVGMYIWEKEKYVDITVRKRNSAVELNVVMEAAAEAVGGSGGGHPAAAGARIPKDKLDRFIHRVNVMLA